LGNNADGGSADIADSYISHLTLIFFYIVLIYTKFAESLLSVTSKSS